MLGRESKHKKLLIIWYNRTVCAHSLTDRIAVCGTVDQGSIPCGRTTLIIRNLVCIGRDAPNW